MVMPQAQAMTSLCFFDNFEKKSKIKIFARKFNPLPGRGGEAF